MAGHSGYECRLGHDADKCDVFPVDMPVENHENVMVGDRCRERRADCRSGLVDGDGLILAGIRPREADGVKCRVEVPRRLS